MDTQPFQMDPRQQQTPVKSLYWIFFDLDQTLLCLNKETSLQKLSKVQNQNLSDCEMVTFHSETSMLALYVKELSPILQSLNNNPLVSFNILTNSLYSHQEMIIPFITKTYLGGDYFTGTVANRDYLGSYLKGDYIKKCLDDDKTTYLNHHVILIDDKIIQRESAKKHNFITIDPTQPDFIDQITSLVASIANPGCVMPLQPLRRSERIKNRMKQNK